jgi:chemotaxis protein methyltransferase CheR
MSAALAEIAARVHRESGILLRGPQLDSLACALDRIGAEANPEMFLGRLLDPVAGPDLAARLLDEVTVKETYFLRDAAQLAQIDWPALLRQAHLNGAPKIRIWSAGCATGEEAYSLALLACEAFNTFDPPVTILATDLSAAALARARAGIYRPRSTRELTEHLGRRYFREDGQELVVADALRPLVRFACHNLVRDPVPPLGEQPFDTILCRNVLIYFDRPTVAGVIERLGRALARGGALVLGAADALCQDPGRPGTVRSAPDIPASPLAPRTLRRPLGRARAPQEAVARDPLDATAHFLRGLAESEDGNPAAAIAAFRAALYADPQFGLAAFQLGRSYEAIDNPAAALRAYRQSLAGLESDPDVDESGLLGQVDVEDVKAAVRTRLELLASA